ncbi:MFS transporter [uncultured Ilyobacter sp.]|uniref:MFS transporter n=1 Tax=uncultured Ilyobacter sp. TaxID=544433 RepID=UPI0029BFCC04|nr:MFS transporter [uncultured Ilyobacter sp.]
MEKRLPRSVQLFYGIGVSYAIVDQIFAQWVLYYYLPPENSGIKPLMAPILISLALVLSRFVDMVSDPLVGYLSDKSNSRWGRRIPFIAVGSIPLGISTVAFFYPVKGGGVDTFLYLSLVGSIFFIFYTIVGAPYNALIPEIGNTPEERLNLSTWQSVFRLVYTAIAMILPGILIKTLGRGDTETGIRMMVILLSTVSALGAYVTVFLVPEKKYSHGKISKTTLGESFKILFHDKSFIYYLLGLLFFFVGFNILRASMNYYVEDIMGMGKGAITGAAAILFGTSALFFYPTNRMAKRVGYRKLMLLALAALALLSLVLYNLGKAIPVSWGFYIFAFMGIPVSGAAFIFPPAMLSEISTHISEKSGHKIEGMCFGIQGFFLKMAFLISIALLPIILVAGGGNIIQAIITSPEGVSRSGVYTTALFSAGSFVISFIFYFLYKE